MPNIDEVISLDKNVNKLVKSGLLLAIAIVFQLIGKTFPQISQFLVGPVVNSILILTTMICGLWYGIGIGVLTPLLAWLLGQLPAPFGPFIPFIMVGNAIFIILFYLFKNRKNGEAIGIVLGAFFKFLFLFFSATTVVKVLKFIINVQILNKLALAMGVLQLVTAIAGGILALILITILRKRKQLS